MGLDTVIAYIGSARRGSLFVVGSSSVDSEASEVGITLRICIIHTEVSISAMAYCQQILSFP